MYVLFSGLLGLIVGSFLNVVILRLPKGEALTGRSHCNYCKRSLSSLELIPLFSYLLLGGKCFGCKKKISPRYFFIELTTGILFLLAYLFIIPENYLEIIQLIRIWFILAVFLVVFIIDLEHYLILDKVVVFSVGGLLVFNVLLDLFSSQSLLSLNTFTIGGVFASLILALVFYIIYFVSKGKWLGFGDVKFMFVYGLALAWPGAVVGFFLTFVLGTLYSIPLLFLGVKKMKSQLPLGVFLTSAGLLALFYWKEILDWYLGLLGV